MKTKINNNNFIYLFLIIINFCKGLGMSNGNKIYLYTYILSLSFILIKIEKNKFMKKELLIIGVLSILGLLDYIYGNETTLLFTTIIIASLKNINTKKILKIALTTRTIAFFTNYIASNTGLIDNKIRLFYRNGVFINRYCLGYNHPNTAHSALSIIIMLVLLMR